MLSNILESFPSYLLDEEQGVEFIKNVLHQRFQYKKDLDQSEIELRDITNSIQNFEQETYDLGKKYV